MISLDPISVGVFDPLRLGRLPMCPQNPAGTLRHMLHVARAVTVQREWNAISGITTSDCRIFFTHGLNYFKTWKVFNKTFIFLS